MRSVMAGPQFFEPGTGSGPRGRPGLSDGLVPPILSSYTPTANSVRNFKSKSGTRIVELLVPLCFRSSCQSALRCITNFRNGALVFEADSHARVEKLRPRSAPRGKG